MIGGLANGVSSGFKAGLGGVAAAGVAAGGLAYAAGKGIGKLKSKIMGGRSDGAGDSGSGSGSASGGLGADTRGEENLGNNGRPEPRPVKKSKDATKGDKVATDFDKNGKRPENPYDAQIHNRYDKKALMRQTKANDLHSSAQTTKRKAEACRQYQSDLANGNVFERGKSKIMGKKAAMLDWSAKRQEKKSGKYAGDAIGYTALSDEKMFGPKAKKKQAERKLRSGINLRFLVQMLIEVQIRYIQRQHRNKFVRLVKSLEEHLSS